MVVGVVLLGAREEGVFGDEFLWMKYQVSGVDCPAVLCVLVRCVVAPWEARER